MFVYTVLCPESSEYFLSPNPSFTSKAAVLVELGFLASDTASYVDTASTDCASAKVVANIFICISFLVCNRTSVTFLFPKCSPEHQRVCLACNMSSGILKPWKVKNFVMVANLVTNGKTTCVCRNKEARSTRVEKSREPWSSFQFVMKSTLECLHGEGKQEQGHVHGTRWCVKQRKQTRKSWQPSRLTKEQGAKVKCRSYMYTALNPRQIKRSNQPTHQPVRIAAHLAWHNQNAYVQVNRF